MRVSIIAADNMVVIDGTAHDCDCSKLLAHGISALQWYGAEGEIEYVGHKQPNEITDSLENFQEFIDKATPVPTFVDNSKFAEEQAIIKREANPETRLGHFHPTPWPTILGPDGMPVRKPGA